MSQASRPLRVLRSIGAFLAGMLVNIIASVGTDAAMVAAGIFPPLNEPGRFTTPLLLLATAYRTLYGIAGSYLTARLAPDHPMGHSLTLGAAGFVACLAGAVTMWGYGPNWYPVALVVLALPTAWVGGKLRLMQMDREDSRTQIDRPSMQTEGSEAG